MGQDKNNIFFFSNVPKTTFDDFSKFNIDMVRAEILCPASNIILGFFLIKSHLP